MSLDLGSATLDVIIALSFVFFLFSLIVTALGEWIAALLGSRAKTLRKGLEGMLGDEKLVRSVLDHALVRTNLRKNPPTTKTGLKGWLESLVAPLLGRERGPSYIAPHNFALAVKDRVGDREVETDSKAVEQLKSLGVDAAKAIDVPQLPTVEKWFDDAMDRVSGWYKRKAQWMTVVLAVVVTVGFNVDAIRVGERIVNDPVVRSKLVEEAEALKPAAPAEAEKDVPAREAMTEEEQEKEAEDLAASVGGTEGAIEKLPMLGLPIFWDGVDDDVTGDTVLGWLLTAIAISFGAPFWFDILGKLTPLRASGKKPDDKKPDET